MLWEKVFVSACKKLGTVRNGPVSYGQKMLTGSPYMGTVFCILYTVSLACFHFVVDYEYKVLKINFKFRIIEAWHKSTLPMDHRRWYTWVSKSRLLPIEGFDESLIIIFYDWTHYWWLILCSTRRDMSCRCDSHSRWAGYLIVELRSYRALNR